MIRVLVPAIFSGLLFLLPLFSAADGVKYKFARGKVEIMKPCQEDWDRDMEDDEHFLSAVKELTTLDVDTKCYVVEFKDIKEVSQYSMIKLQASRPPVFTEQEITVIREYLNRGGLIFGDDHHEGGDPKNPRPGALGTKDEFFRGMIKIVEEQLYPGKKMFLVPLDHALYHCYFELPNGWPACIGGKHTQPMGLANDKDGHIMILLFGSGLNGGWADAVKWGIPMIKKRQAIKAGINMLVYTQTH